MHNMDNLINFGKAGYWKGGYLAQNLLLVDFDTAPGRMIWFCSDNDNDDEWIVGKGCVVDDKSSIEAGFAKACIQICPLGCNGSWINQTLLGELYHIGDDRIKLHNKTILLEDSKVFFLPHLKKLLSLEPKSTPKLLAPKSDVVAISYDSMTKKVYLHDYNVTRTVTDVDEDRVEATKENLEPCRNYMVNQFHYYVSVDVLKKVVLVEDDSDSVRLSLDPGRIIRLQCTGNTEHINHIKKWVMDEVTKLTQHKFLGGIRVDQISCCIYNQDTRIYRMDGPGLCMEFSELGKKESIIDLVDLDPDFFHVDGSPYHMCIRRSVWKPMEMNIEIQTQSLSLEFDIDSHHVKMEWGDYSKWSRFWKDMMRYISI